MKKAIRNAGVILLLCLPGAAFAQPRIQYSDPAYREQAKQIGAKVELALSTKEPDLKLKTSVETEFGFHQYYERGNEKVNVSILVYPSVDEASKNLLADANSSSVAGYEKLSGFGDEAYYQTYRSFSWVGVRQGTIVVEVGAGPQLKTTRRLAQYGLEQIERK